MKSKAHGFCNRIRRLKRNRNGFSMVEIIMVIAVMGLLASSAFSLTNYLKYADVQKALKTIEDQINKLQVTSMSKKDKQEIRIYKVGNDTYLKVGPASMTLDNQGIKLGNSAVVIKGVDSAGGEFPVTATSTIKVKYQRSGIFSTDTNVEKIMVCGKNTTYTIKLLQNTGKVKVE